MEIHESNGNLYIERVSKGKYFVWSICFLGAIIFLCHKYVLPRLFIVSSGIILGYKVPFVIATLLVSFLSKMPILRENKLLISITTILVVFSQAIVLGICYDRGFSKVDWYVYVVAIVNLIYFLFEFYEAILTKKIINNVVLNVNGKEVPIINVKDTMLRAEQGSPMDMLNIAGWYTYGTNGFPVNYKSAKEWAQKVVNDVNWNEEALKLLELIETEKKKNAKSFFSAIYDFISNMV